MLMVMIFSESKLIQMLEREDELRSSSKYLSPIEKEHQPHMIIQTLNHHQLR